MAVVKSIRFFGIISFNLRVFTWFLSSVVWCGVVEWMRGSSEKSRWSHYSI
jgi:hypothetical protein